MNGKDDMGQEIARSIAHGIAKRIAMGIAFFLMFVIFVFLGGFIVQWLWNWLMPSIFGLRTLSWFEAFGLLALSRILFGGFGRGGGSHGPSRHRREWWKKKIGEWKPDGGGASSAEQHAAGVS